MPDCSSDRLPSLSCTYRQLAKEPGALCGTGGHELSILTPQDEAGAHVDIARHDRLIVDPRHSGKFAVRARPGDHCAIGFADPLVAEIAVDAHLGAQIVGADQ